MSAFIGGLYVAIIGFAIGFCCGWSSRGERDAQSIAAAVERGEVRLTQQEADQ